MARTRLPVKGIIFDMYGTVVDVGAVAEACSKVAPDPIAFNNQWRAKQLEYTFLRTLMGKYRDFWKVTEEALACAVERFTLQMAAEQRQRLMEAWLLPSPYPEGHGGSASVKGKTPFGGIVQRNPHNASDRPGTSRAHVAFSVADQCRLNEAV